MGFGFGFAHVSPLSVGEPVKRTQSSTPKIGLSSEIVQIACKCMWALDLRVRGFLGVKFNHLSILEFPLFTDSAHQNAFCTPERHSAQQNAGRAHRIRISRISHSSHGFPLLRGLPSSPSSRVFPSSPSGSLDDPPLPSRAGARCAGNLPFWARNKNPKSP